MAENFSTVLNQLATREPGSSYTPRRMLTTPLFHCLPFVLKFERARVCCPREREFQSPVFSFFSFFSLTFSLSLFTIKTNAVTPLSYRHSAILTIAYCKRNRIRFQVKSVVGPFMGCSRTRIYPAPASAFPITRFSPANPHSFNHSNANSKHRMPQ